MGEVEVIRLEEAVEVELAAIDVTGRDVHLNVEQVDPDVVPRFQETFEGSDGYRFDQNSFVYGDLKETILRRPLRRCWQICPSVLLL